MLNRILQFVAGAFGSLHQAAVEGEVEFMRQLIRRGVSVDGRDDQGCTPLHLAALEGRYEVAECLISSNCDLNPVDNNGSTPVLRAAQREYKDIVDLLIRHGARIDCADSLQRTLLHWGAYYCWEDIVRLMLDSGADINATDTEGITPLMYAAMGDSSKARGVASLLLQAGAGIHQKNLYGCTVLHCAALYCQTEVVPMLLEVEGGLDLLNQQSNEGETPLHRVCRWRRPEIARRLLAAGTDANLRNNEGDTALSKGLRHEVLTAEDITFFVQHGAFIEPCSYEQIYEDPSLKDVLKDVDTCTQSIINKFHHQTLPALKDKCTGRLPSTDKFKLLPEHVCDVENFVRWDIQANTFCNVVQARPMVLRMMCVESLLA